MMRGMGLRHWIYARLGFCSLGEWRHIRRGRMPGAIVAWDDAGREVGRHKHQFCDEHLTATVNAMASVPHTGTAEMDDGTTINWSTEPDGGTDG